MPLVKGDRNTRTHSTTRTTYRSYLVSNFRYDQGLLLIFTVACNTIKCGLLFSSVKAEIVKKNVKPEIRAVPPRISDTTFIH